jgi:outer membrane protein OmpA-like peptidoglycan-associated protein
MRFHPSILLLAGLALVVKEDPAEACGLKLSKKAIKIAEPIRPSANPSKILVAGDGSERVKRVLQQAGHVVQTSESLNDVRDDGYRVVLVDDPETGNKARERWPDAHVLAIADRTRANLTAVEKVLGRDGLGGGALINTADRRLPVRAGPTAADEENRKVVGAGPQDGEQPAEVAETKPAPEPEPAAEPKPAEKPEPVVQEEEKPVVAAAAVREEKPKTIEREEKPIEEPEPEPEPVRETKVKPARTSKKKVVEEEPEAAPVAARTERREAAPASLPEERELQFFAASARLIGPHRRLLDQIARWAKQNPNAKITLEGHASTDGAPEFNTRISERRARSAYQYLLKKGVSSRRMTSTSYGEARPKYEPGGAPENRRVEIVIEE